MRTCPHMHGVDATLMMGVPGTERVLRYVFGKSQTYTLVDENNFFALLFLVLQHEKQKHW